MLMNIREALLAAVVVGLFLLLGMSGVQAEEDIVLVDEDSTQMVSLNRPDDLLALTPAVRNWIKFNGALHTPRKPLAPEPASFTIAPRIMMKGSLSAPLSSMSSRPEPPQSSVVRILIEEGAAIQRTFLADAPLPPVDTVSGIDVSQSQGDIDWEMVQGAGYGFTFAKATEGLDFEDPNLAVNMANSRSAGLEAGAYHFARPDLGNDAASEAQHFMIAARGYISRGYLKPALVLRCGAEMTGVCSGGTLLNQAELSQWVNDWMLTVRNRTGVEPVLHVDSNYANNYLDTSVTQYKLWIADYRPLEPLDLGPPPDTGIWSDWDFWQYSDQGTVEGITGNTNLDLFKGDNQGLKEFVIDPRVPDLNCDGAVNIFDAITLLQIIVGLVDFPPC